MNARRFHITLVQVAYTAGSKLDVMLQNHAHMSVFNLFKVNTEKRSEDEPETKDVELCTVRVKH